MDNYKFYIHKYQPRKYEDYIFNKDLIERLKDFSRKDYLPHIIFHGPHGAGKHSVVLTFLGYLLSKDENINEIIYSRQNIEYFITSDDKKSDNSPINIVQNLHYFELDADDYGYNDKKIFYNFISEISNTIDISTQKYKIIIIKNADKLSMEAQHTLKRIMELKYKTLRIIFLLNNISLIDNAIKSRCIMIKVPGPTEDNIKEVIKNIIKKEELILSEENVNKIIKISDNNLTKALLILEGSIIGDKFDLAEDRLRKFINEFSDSIIKTKSANLDLIRNKMYLFLLHNTDISEIFELITKNIVSKLKCDKMIKKILKSAIYYNENCQLGYRDIYHFESFVIYLINILNNNQTELLEDIV